MKTIIDILKKGNQELFHSSMIAWLLDPNAEHNLGPQFIEKFAERLKVLGDPSLLDKIKENHSPSSVRTETTSYRSRYDIEIIIGDFKLIIENKTKTIGEYSQLEKYSGDKEKLIALGLTDISFPSEIKNKYSHVTFMTYRDILDLLNSIKPVGADVFSMLITEYKKYLSREIQLFDLIEKCYADGNLDLHEKIVDLFNVSGSRNQNDLRFINLFYLEKFKETLIKTQRFGTSIWQADKNMQSGVWLANHGKNNLVFSTEIQDVMNRMDFSMWFHIELRDGVIAKSLENISGEIQLRCHDKKSTKSANRVFVDEMKRLISLREGECYPSRLNNNWDTFYLVKRDLRKKDLVFKNLIETLESFVRGFCVI